MYFNTRTVLALCMISVMIGRSWGVAVYASCHVYSTTGSTDSNVAGTIDLIQHEEGNTDIKVALTGFTSTPPTQKHGFHVHEHGEMGNKCKDAGGHFNPLGKDHGAPGDTNRHVGDLGNIVVQDGSVTTTLTDGLVNLTGTNNVIGKAFVIHAGEDDLGKGGYDDSKTTGHAGARLACCKIHLNSAGSLTDSSGSSPVTGPALIVIMASLLFALLV